jgi:hypothetical protein
MATTKKETVGITIPAIEKRKLSVRLVGDSPLIVHRWSEKAKKEMLDKMIGAAKKGKAPKRPIQEYADAFYWISEKPDFDDMDEDDIMKCVDKGRFGFPAVAFKKAAIDAAYQQKAIDKKTTMRGAFHIDGELVEIKGKPTIREDPVTVGISGTDMRYRPEFPKWSVTLTIIFNPNAVTQEQVVNALNIAGFSNGVGEWRPEKDGVYGRFHVE